MNVFLKIPGALAILLLTYLSGWATWMLFHRGDRGGWGAPGRPPDLFCQFAAGVAVGGVIALVFSVLGWFHAWSFAACILGYFTLTLVLLRPGPHSLRRSLPVIADAFREYRLVIIAMIVGLMLFPLPFMFAFGGGDNGVYVNIAGNIKRTGSALSRDNAIPKVEEKKQYILYRRARLPNRPRNEIEYTVLEPGFFISDFARGNLTPQFFWLFPAWMAAFMVFLGVRGGFFVVTFFALLSIWAMFMLAREIMGKWAAAAASVFLVVNFLEVYFAKTSFSENVTQFFFLLWLYAYIRYRKEMASGDGREITWWGFLAGAGLGCVMLAHIYGFLLIAPLWLLYCFYIARDGWKAVTRDRAFLLTYGSFLMFTLAMIAGPYRPYANAMQAKIRDISGGWPAVAIVLVALVSLAFLIHRLSPGAVEWLGRNRKYVSTLAGVVLLLAVAYGFLIWPRPGPDIIVNGNIVGFRTHSFQYFAYYLTALGAFLAVAGYCLFFWRGLNSQNLILPLAGLMMTGYFLFEIKTGPFVYIMRRFVPMALPASILMAAYALYWLWTQWHGRDLRSREVMWSARAVSLIAGVALLGWTLVPTVRIARVNGSRESYPFVVEVSNLAPDPAVIVCDKLAGHILAAPLRSFQGRQVIRPWRDSYLNDPWFYKFMKSYEKQGKSIYLVVAPGREALKYSKVYRRKQVGTAVFHSWTVEETQKPAPPRTVPFDFPVDVYRITTSKTAPI